jgi:hypothetical protein
VAALALLTIAVAVAGRTGGDPASIPRGQTAGSGPNSIPPPVQADASDRSTGAGAPPASIACGVIASWWCRHVVQASLELLPADETASSARVYATLVCGDDLDCPRSFLAGGSPAGSVVLTLADGASAWINVIAVGSPRRIGEPPPRFVGRVVRWFPPDA